MDNLSIKSMASLDKYHIQKSSNDMKNKRIKGRRMPYKRKKDTVNEQVEHVTKEISDTEQDIEWTEVAIGKQETMETAETTTDRELISLSSMNSMVTEVCKEQQQINNKERRGNKPLYNANDRKQAVAMHKTHLLILLSALLKLNDLASDSLVMACCISKVPIDCHVTKEDLQLEVEDWKEKFLRLFLFVLQLVKEENWKEMKKDSHLLCWQSQDMIEWVQHPQPILSCIILFLCSVFRGFGFSCRIVQSLIPLSTQPWWSKSNTTTGSVLNKPTHQVKGDHMIQYDSFWWLYAPWTIILEQSNIKLCQANTQNGQSLPCLYWLELYHPYWKRWIHMDPINLLIDQPSWIETSYKKWKHHPFRHKVYPVYITAVEKENEDIVRDVTRRYISSLSLIETHRKDKFWQETVKQWEKKSHWLLQRIVDEDLELQHLQEKEPIPKNLHSLKHHPIYVIGKHLKKYETIYPPDAIVGYYGDLPVYLRSSIHSLHSRERWIREFRQVRPHEVAVKRVRSRGNNKHGEEGWTELFGLWQTDQFIPPTAQDGKVPKNERGNVELWTPRHLPKGCVHIRYANAATIAKQLSIDYAPAMIGFDIHGGRSVPIWDGIVVAKEYQAILQDACQQDWQRRESQKMKRRYEEVLKLWKVCIRGVRSHLEVKQKYGGLLEDDLSYEKSLKRRAFIAYRKGTNSNLSTAESVEEKETSNTPFKPSLTNQSQHIHEFSEEVPLIDATFSTTGATKWFKKQCQWCGLEVTFEKFD